MEKVIKNSKERFIAFKDFWLLLHGSHVTDYSTPKSDVDIVLVTKIKEREVNKKKYYGIIEYNTPPYDFKIFELLPLSMQIEIINNYKVIFGDELDISEYFYHFRKKWKDQERRIKENQIMTIEDYQIGLKNRKLVLKHLKKMKVN